MLDGINPPSNGGLDARRTPSVNRHALALLRAFDVNAILGMTLASEDQLDRMDASQDAYLEHLSQTEADFKAARKEITIMSVIAPLAQANQTLDLIWSVAKAIDPAITEPQVSSIIRDKLHLDQYDPPQP